MRRRSVRSLCRTPFKSLIARSPACAVFLEGIHEAQGNEEIAFSPYLPTLAGGISGGGFDLNVQGQVANGFSFLPPGAVVPVGLNLESGYGSGRRPAAVVDLRFWAPRGSLLPGRTGRRDRLAPAGVARTRPWRMKSPSPITRCCEPTSLRRIAQDAVRRAERRSWRGAELEKGGVIEREKSCVSRSNWLRASGSWTVPRERSPSRWRRSTWRWAWMCRRRLRSSKSTRCRLRRIRWASACNWRLHSAANWTSLAAAFRSLRKATRREGRLSAENYRRGGLLQFRADDAAGQCRSGTRFHQVGVGPVRGRPPHGRAESRRLENAGRHGAGRIHRRHHQFSDRRGLPSDDRPRFKAIDLAKPAVTQARENYRLVKARAAQGDATATELTDAETALTRAEQDHLNSIYDYLTARARLDYAMGQTPGRGGP